MRINSVNVNFCKRHHLPKGNYNVTSLLTNRPIIREEIWNDLKKYVESKPELTYRKFTKSERFIFANLPTTEIKKMYLQKLLSNSQK